MRKHYSLLLAAVLPAFAQAQLLKIYSRLTPTEVIETTRVDSMTTTLEADPMLPEVSHLTAIIHAQASDETSVTEKRNLELVDSMRFYNVNEQTNVWETLEAAGNYTYFLRLIGDYDVLHPASVGGRSLREMLSGWNDREVYAANDAAWEAFFAGNAKRPDSDPWHTATSYDHLSVAQKLLLAGTAVLPSYGTGAGRLLAKSEYLRFRPAYSTTDSVTVIPETALPHTYNQSAKDYWARFRTENGGTGYAVMGDYEAPMTMVLDKHWCQKFGVTDEDFALITGQDASVSTAANGSEIRQETETENGAVNITGQPLVPQANMAEVIRTNGRTHIFSHILDRFSAPFYDETLTLAMRDKKSQAGQDFQDSVFVKRYFSNMSYGHEALNKEPGPGATLVEHDNWTNGALKFDPAWNGYYDETSPEKDMAAMFVPSDVALCRYFTEGGGKSLIALYSTLAEHYESEEDLYRAIDQIPLNIMQVFINNIMMRSFGGSVPSKMTRLRDDAMEPLFYAEDREKIDTCLLASNGVVYVMDDVYGPLDFTGVTAPAYAAADCNIMKWAIYDGANGMQEYMGLNFYTILKAPQARLTFFLPTDEAMKFYYDPISFKSLTSRVIQFSYKSASFPIQSRCLSYTPTTGITGRVIAGQGASIQQGEMANRLKDILLSHTILNDWRQNIHSRNEYFETLGGPIVKVVRDAQGNIRQVLGGFQIENQRNGLASEEKGVKACNVSASFESLKNGETYALDAPAIPTYRSLWNILSGRAEDEYDIKTEEENPYALFFNLCKVNEDCIRACGLVDANLSSKMQKVQMQKFLLFANDKGLDMNATFLRANFTAFIPTNEAIRKAIAQGLPTWEDIEKDCEGLTTFEDSMRVQEKIWRLTDFVKGHFIYGQAVADQEPFSDDFVQPMIDINLGVAPKLQVHSLGGGEMTVTDANGKTCRVTGERNTIVRDIVCSSSPATSTMPRNITLNRAQCGVVHQIDGVLNFEPMY